MNFLKNSSPKPLSPLMGVVAAALLGIEFCAMLRHFDTDHAPILVALSLAAVIFAFCLLRDLSFKFAAKITNQISHLFFSWLFQCASRAFSMDLYVHLVQKRRTANQLWLISRDARTEKTDFMLYPGAFLRAITLASFFPVLLPVFPTKS